MKVMKQPISSGAGVIWAVWITNITSSRNSWIFRLPTGCETRITELMNATRTIIALFGVLAVTSGCGGSSPGGNPGGAAGAGGGGGGGGSGTGGNSHLGP